MGTNFENRPLYEKEALKRGAENVAGWFKGLDAETQRQIVASLIEDATPPIEDASPANTEHEVVEGESFDSAVTKILEENV